MCRISAARIDFGHPVFGFSRLARFRAALLASKAAFGELPAAAQQPYHDRAEEDRQRYFHALKRSRLERFAHSFVYDASTPSITHMSEPHGMAPLLLALPPGR